MYSVHLPTRLRKRAAATPSVQLTIVKVIFPRECSTLIFVSGIFSVVPFMFLFKSTNFPPHNCSGIKYQHRSVISKLVTQVVFCSLLASCDDLLVIAMQCRFVHFCSIVPTSLCCLANFNLVNFN